MSRLMFASLSQGCESAVLQNRVTILQLYIKQTLESEEDM